ncbi:lipopolysaccharide biosynthesis protein [bacterium]|nr:lipopolysaccharide biosynthesis protein [bacterium]
MSLAQEQPYAEIFSTGHLKADLKERSIRGGALTLSAQAVKFCMQFGTTAVLARLLVPGDFGLIAMVMAVTGFVAMFKDAGLSMATLQRAEIDHAQVSSLFWINVGLSFILMLIVAALAPALAWFNHEPRLFGITLVFAATFIFSGLTLQHLALLRRQMRFGALVAIDLTTALTRVTTGIVMAVLGFGYWSLVGMAVAEAVANCALVWIASPWRPGRFTRGCGIGPMLSFGGFLTVASLFNYACENLPLVLIGRFLGSGPVGLFDRAYRLTLMPMSQMSSPIASVAIPALCRVQDEPERFRGICRRLILIACGVTVPMAVVGVLVAPELIHVYLGEKWSRAAGLFACLSPLAATESISVIAVWILMTTGNSKACFQFSIWNAILSGASILLGLHYGLEAAALSFSGIGLLVRTPLLYHFVVARTMMRWPDLLGRPSWFLIGGALITASGLCLRYLVLHIDQPSLAWAVGAMVVTVIVWLPLMWHARLLHELMSLKSSWSSSRPTA